MMSADEKRWRLIPPGGDWIEFDSMDAAIHFAHNKVGCALWAEKETE